MPHVTVRVTRTGVTREQKAALIKGVTDLLGKDPERTFVVIDEVELDHGGSGGESSADRWTKRK